MIAEEGQPQVQAAHEDGNGGAGHPDTGHVFLFRSELNPLQGADGDDAEGKGSQGIDGVIAFDKAGAKGRGRVFSHGNRF